MDLFQIFNAIKELVVSAKDFLVAVNWPQVTSVLKVVSLVVSAALFVGIVELIIRLNLVSRIRKAGKLFVAPAFVTKKLVKKWNKIEERLKLEQEAELKLAVIEADKFFDDVLKRCGYLGKDMGDRLKKINSSQISNIDEIWSAHKVRNNIVHDTDFKLNEFEAEKAIKAYKKALEELEVL